MRPLLVLSLALQYLFVNAGNDFGRTYSDTIPQRFRLDVAKLREHIYSQVPGACKKDWLERSTYYFADQNAQGICNLLTSGEVYSDWNSLEDYFNEILRKVTPPELREDSVIHAYVIQNASYNAFMTPSGHTFIHIGLMANVINEASIAAVLAHELAHYYLKHSLYSYVEKVQGNFDLGLFNASNRLANQYSIKSELEADSLAIRWLYNSGYNLDAMISTFEIMSRLERNWIKRSPDQWKLKETTHPLSAERTSRIKNFYTKHLDYQGKDFLIDEQKFKNFRNEAKTEILKILLNKFDYPTCTEMAFRFHIFDPDNGTYIYYLMESIRRHCYLFPELWSKLFITERYFDSVMTDGVKHKEKMTAHLFKMFDMEILPIVPEEGSQLKTKFYWKDQPKFTTNEEAFNFFYKVSLSVKMNESILSNALSFPNDKALRNKFLQKYLACDSIMHREYAQSLLDSSNFQKLPKNKLLLFHSFRVAVRYGKEDIGIPNENASCRKTLHTILDSVATHLDKRTPLFGPELKYYKCNDYKMLSDLEDFSFSYIIAKGQRTELHMLDPKYWEMFYRYKVNEIEFINCGYFESHPKDRSLEAYKRVVNSDYEQIFSEKNTIKYFEVFSSSVRQIRGGVMKVKHYSWENKISPKEPILDQLVTRIRVEIKEKDKYTSKLDSWKNQ